ncbi:IS6 family transposase, partial [Klebsiella pneumoniae]
MKTAYDTTKVFEVRLALRIGKASDFYYGEPLSEMRLLSLVF